ncbi:hypothetical protein [Mycoplasmopsis bovirhinis]|nr:hypothetical protein [Mycoplasmopsis bovirhinis]
MTKYLLDIVNKLHKLREARNSALNYLEDKSDDYGKYNADDLRDGAEIVF